MINAAKIKNIISLKSGGDSTISAQLYQMFFFERILERISKSEYKHNIILKGGLLLSSIIGENMRTTKDMDATMKGVSLKKDNILSIMQSILDLDIKDGVTFEILGIKNIRQENEYGGFKLNIVGKLERLKVNFFIEFTTGDEITPREIEYCYKSIFDDNVISIFAYTVETVIAEKFETLISRSVLNTRYKDFYDLGILIEDKEQIYNDKVLIIAIERTFKKRGTDYNIDFIKQTYKLIKDDKKLREEWSKYQDKYFWSKRITYDKIMENIEKLIVILENSE